VGPLATSRGWDRTEISLLRPLVIQTARVAKATVGLQCKPTQEFSL